MKNRVIATSVALALSFGSAHAGGIPVIDAAAIAQAVKDFEQGAAQLKQLQEQLQQAKELYGSLNGLTDMSNIADILNKPEIRQALPEDFAAVESLLKGEGEDRFGDSARKFLDQNVSYESEANDFYAQELAKAQKRSAGQMTVGEQIYNAGTKRIEGIEELREQISNSENAKETADLQARIQAETAALQADNLRMQGLAMVQQAQIRVAEQRAEEERRRTYEAMAKKYGGK